MNGLVRIPMFPLSIFPLPGELVPLHIFEQRYRQLLQEAESRDISFGIYFNHTSNAEKLGSLVKLESVIKRYASGESDVIVKCADLFSMTTLFRTFKDKLYPGGDVTFLKIDTQQPLTEKLDSAFLEYLQLLKIHQQGRTCSIFEVANELNLTFQERLKFVQMDRGRMEAFLYARVRYQSALLRQAEKSKNVFHLN